MTPRHFVAAASATALAAGTLAFAAPAQAAAGNDSLYDVLAADVTKKGAPSFDRNGKDFDILTAAVFAVLDAKPGSPVGVLADGSVKLTAFIPTDGAFKRTGQDLGIKAKNEAKRATKYVNRLGVDGVESVLLYHVIAGQKINAKTAAGADGAKLETALGQKFTVNVTHQGIFLKDRARDIANPKVIVTDINKGNKQIAHAINRVLLPAL
ncbi:MAG: fasciclin domain-containing protein [Actinomycetota bacterium]|nr:fasciclin domain-containing protein [Actinomycetota bacterium]